MIWSEVSENTFVGEFVLVKVLFIDFYYFQVSSMKSNNGVLVRFYV